MSEPLITFCVMHVQRLDCTRRCIEQIFKTTHVPFRILILIQGYSHTINELSYFIDLARKHNNITFIYTMQEDYNIGPPAGRGLLISQADTPLIMTLDNDTYLQEGWLEPILKAFKRKEVVAATMPLYNKNGTLFSSGGGKISTLNGVFQDRLVNLSSWIKKDFVPVDSVCEGCMIFRREAKPYIVWDPEYKIGYGGLDMSLTFMAKAKPKGLLQVVSVKSKAEHWQHPLPSYKVVRMNYPALAKSYARFREKWGLRLPWKKHFIVKYGYPLLRKPVAQFLRWLRRKPPLIWVSKPKVR